MEEVSRIKIANYLKAIVLKLSLKNIPSKAATFFF